MPDNRRRIALEPHSVGALVSEVIRAQLHGGTPSALLVRIKVGVTNFLQESHNEEDRRVVAAFQRMLDDTIAKWKKEEDTFFHELPENA